MAAMLLERELELTELGEAITQSQAGRGRVVLVEAPAGLGKTSLLEAACESAAEAGFACLRARATELERDFAYGCVRQLLEPAVARSPESERVRLYEGAAALAQPLFAPTLPPSAHSAFSVLHGLYWLVNNLCDKSPVALAIDDIHWADTESLRFFNYLAPRLDGLRLAVFASARSGEGVTDLARLAAGPETTVLRPRPLSTGATVRLSARMLGVEVAPEFAAACRETTGGNPFFLEALLREVSDRGVAPDQDGAAVVRSIGPAAVAEAVLLRLSERPPATTALVRAVAIIGDGAELGEAAELAELPGDEAARAADELSALAILRAGEGLEFTHPIVREAVYEDLGAHERAQAHARAAAILAASGASGERVAAQIVEADPAGDPGRVELLRGVARYALCRGAPAAAVAWLRRALAEPPPAAESAAVLLELGSAELRTAAPEAVEHLSAAVDEIREPALLSTSSRLLANALTWSDESDRAVDVLESAIDAVEPVDRELALVLVAELAAHAQEAGIEARAPAARRLERYADLDGATPGERLVLASLAFERARTSESEREAAAWLERGLAGGQLLDEQEIDVPPPIYVVLVGLLATEAVDVAEALLSRMLVDARARVSIPAMAFVLAHQAVASTRRGDVARAEADAREALDLLTAHEIPLGKALALAILVEALVESGDVASAEQAFEDSAFAAEIEPGLPTNALHEARGILRLAQGRTRDGLDDLVEFGRRDELWGGASPLASRWRSRAALAHAALGEEHEARRLAEEDLERARRWGAPSGIGIALRAAALTAGGEGSIEGLREAAEVLGPSFARLEHARALVDLGAALRRANRRAEARGELERGLALAEQCGAGALAEHARTELRAAGGRVSNGRGAGVDQLTVSERRVAELAAEGHSNPEIAQTLYVTRKTVETHLGRVYRKLGISGRMKLAQALSEPVSTVDA